MFAKTKRILFSVVCVLLSAALVTVAYAWFAGYWSSENSKIDFTTSGNAALGDMWVWMYKSPFEVETDTPRWIMSTADKATDGSGFIIQGYRQNTDENATDQFILQSLHFGKIDNLTTLNPDNKIYFCFKLNKDTHGSDKISFTFDYAYYNYSDVNSGTKPEGYPDNDPRYSIRIFDMDKYEINHFEGEGLTYDSNNKKLMELLEFSYCVSSTPPPSAAEIEGNDPFSESLTFSSPTAITNELSEQSITGLSDSKDYYLYVCISPRLENYGLHDHILTFFAQSYMLFDVIFYFDVHD